VAARRIESAAETTGSEAVVAQRWLLHEHAVPKSVVINKLLALAEPTWEAVYAICEKYLIGVVVTREEDALLNEFRMTMPSDFEDLKSASFDNPWLRYERCNIKPQSMAHFDFGHFETSLQRLMESGSKLL
jgi:hypothetical protein